MRVLYNEDPFRDVRPIGRWHRKIDIPEKL